MMAVQVNIYVGRKVKSDPVVKTALENGFTLEQLGFGEEDKLSYVVVAPHGAESGKNLTQVLDDCVETILPSQTISLIL